MNIFSNWGMVQENMQYVGRSENQKKLEENFCIPGNAGISEVAVCKEINPSNKKDILNFVKDEKNRISCNWT